MNEWCKIKEGKTRMKIEASQYKWKRKIKLKSSNGNNSGNAIVKNRITIGLPFITYSEWTPLESIPCMKIQSKDRKKGRKLYRTLLLPYIRIINCILFSIIQSHSKHTHTHKLQFNYICSLIKSNQIVHQNCFRPIFRTKVIQKKTFNTISQTE